MHIEGSVALVTGANQGIGKVFTEELLERGAAKVYAGVLDMATATDARTVPVQLDVTAAEQVAAAARELRDVTLVVNNAGVSSAGFPLSASLDGARREIEINYLGLVSMTQAFAPVLARNGGGAFINVLSAFAWVAMPLLSTYTASKAAAWNYTNAARIELRRHSTEVVAVHSGFVDTALTAPLDVEKIAPAVLVGSALDALQAGEPEAVVDDFSSAVKAGLSDDQRSLYPQVEREFLAMVNSPTSAV